jgi:hypothetical protein
LIDENHIDRFLALFRANTRSYGVYMPNAKTKMMTVKAAFSAEHVRAHLAGEQGLGAVPIMDDSKCWFGVLDIDVHGPNGVHVDLQAIEEKVRRAELPLTVCRSKSGGAHCYLFMKEATDAAHVRSTLARWAGVIGYAGCEVFPKQVNLDKPPTEAERPLGNWINLPYFDAFETERFALDGGKQVTLEYFLEIAEGRRCDLKDFDKGNLDDYMQGPPCLESMILNKVDSGSRNTAAFQAAVYLKRAYADDWRQRLDGFNRVAFSDPLAPRELRTIIGSVGKKDYQYKCREEPCKSFCQKDACKKRDFGITDRDSAANEIPLIDSVVKVIASPVRWEVTVKGTMVEVPTERLFNYELFRQAVAEKLHLVLPRIKPQEWDVYLAEMMTKVTVRQETTLDDLIFQRLCEYLRRLRVDKSRPEDERREDLRRGTPTIVSISTITFTEGVVSEKEPPRWYYAFKVSDFVEYMWRKKSLPCQDHQVPSYLFRILGEDAKRDKMRVGKNHKISNVWLVPESSVEDEEVPTKEIKAEF